MKFARYNFSKESTTLARPGAVIDDYMGDLRAGYARYLAEKMNDPRARDITHIERKEGAAWLGKNYDTFCPSRPWFVSRDEIPDPMNLKIVTRVNGEIRQNGSTNGMICSIPRLISYVSQVKLEPGDIIATGTPAGSANERLAGQSSWYLQPRDLVQCEVERIGTLRNKVAAEPPAAEHSWKW